MQQLDFLWPVVQFLAGLARRFLELLASLGSRILALLQVDLNPERVRLNKAFGILVSLVVLFLLCGILTIVPSAIDVTDTPELQATKNQPPITAVPSPIPTVEPDVQPDTSGATPTLTPDTTIVSGTANFAQTSGSMSIAGNPGLCNINGTEDEKRLALEYAFSQASLAQSNTGLSVIIYCVDQGDTLFKIAGDQASTVDLIKEANQLDDINLIVLGTYIVVPVQG